MLIGTRLRSHKMDYMHQYNRVTHGVSIRTLHTEAMTLKQSVAFSRVRAGFCGGGGGYHT